MELVVTYEYCLKADGSFDHSGFIENGKTSDFSAADMVDACVFLQQPFTHQVRVSVTKEDLRERLLAIRPVVIKHSTTSVSIQVPGTPKNGGFGGENCNMRVTAFVDFEDEGELKSTLEFLACTLHGVPVSPELLAIIS